MREKTSRISSFFLAAFFIFSCLNLSASVSEGERAAPLIQANAQVKDGVLYVCLKAPEHLTINESYVLFSREGGRGLEGDFLFTEITSENPRWITFSVLVKNTDQGIDCIIDEVQVFEEQGWFSSTLSRKEASQVVRVQNNTVNMAVKPEMRIARNVFNNSSIVLFTLM